MGRHGVADQTKKGALMDESMFGELDELSLPELPDSVWMRLLANALDPDAAPVDDGLIPVDLPTDGEPEDDPGMFIDNGGSADDVAGASIDDGDAGDDPPADQPGHHEGGVADDSYGGEFDHPGGDFGTDPFASPFSDPFGGQSGEGWDGSGDDPFHDHT